MSTHAGGARRQSQAQKASGARQAARRTGQHLGAQPRKPATTRPLRAERPEARPGTLRASPRGLQEKLTLTKAQQADYKELKAKAATYERQVDVYGRREAQLTARGDRQGATFYRLMSSAARSQLAVLADYERKRETLKGQRAALRAEADRTKTQAMLAGKPRKPLAAAGSALAWARANPDEVGRERSSLNEPIREDTALTKIAEEMGYTLKPWLATRSQMDRLVGELGAREFYRGFSSRLQYGTLESAIARAKGYAKDFMRGPYHASLGTYGSGYYTAGGEEGRQTAHEYAQTGVVVRGAIIPGAKFAEFDQTKLQMEREGNAYLRAHGVTPRWKPTGDFISRPGAMLATSVDPASRSLSPADRGEYLLHYGDVGRYAASKGVDVLGDTRGGYWLILNRGVMVVQRATEKFSSRIMQGYEPRRRKAR